MKKIIGTFLMGLFMMPLAAVAQGTGTINESDIPKAVLEELSPIYDAYFNFQEALAQDNFEEAQAALVKMEESINLANMDQLEGERRAEWMELKERLLNNAMQGQEAPSIKEIRAEVLKDLAEAVLAMEKEFGHSGSSPHYEAFCPMALNTGASWLQKEKPVLNPFYGKSMQGCGELKMEFQPRGI